MVARVALHNMKQGRDEPVRAFGARLRGQASVCRHKSARVVMPMLITLRPWSRTCGPFEDNEIQMDLLGTRTRTCR